MMDMEVSRNLDSLPDYVMLIGAVANNLLLTAGRLSLQVVMQMYVLTEQYQADSGLGFMTLTFSQYIYNQH